MNINVYMYINECIFVDHCVCSWMGGQREDLISDIFKECPEDLSLSILAWRPHKELCSQKLATLEERIKDINQSGARLRSSQFGVRLWSGQLGVRLRCGQLGVRLRSGQLRVRLRNMESRHTAVKAMWSVRSETQKWSVESETPKHGVKTHSSEGDNKQQGPHH